MRINLDDAICAAVFASSGSFKTRHDAGGGSTARGSSTPESRTRGFGVKTHRRLRRIMTRIARRLDLTSTQRAEIRSIIDTERPTIGPLLLHLIQLGPERQTLPRHDRFTEILEARRIAAQRARVKVELAVARERVRARVYDVLTAEQRLNATRMIEYLEARLHEPFSGRAA